MKRIKKLSVMLLCCLLLSVITCWVSNSAAKLEQKGYFLNVGKNLYFESKWNKGKKYLDKQQRV